MNCTLAVLISRVWHLQEGWPGCRKIRGPQVSTAIGTSPLLAALKFFMPAILTALRRRPSRPACPRASAGHKRSACRSQDQHAQEGHCMELMYTQYFTLATQLQPRAYSSISCQSSSRVGRQIGSHRKSSHGMDTQNSARIPVPLQQLQHGAGTPVHAPTVAVCLISP